MPVRSSDFSSISPGPLARLFSIRVLRELGDKGTSRTASEIIKESALFPRENQLLDDFLQKAYRILTTSFRSEYVFKNAIAEKILLGKHNLRTATMLTEFRAGKNKADVVILNGHSTAYEIKSERDTMFRLDDQILSYRRVFEQVVVVTDDCYLDEVFDRTPADVGITVLSERYTLSERRAPQTDWSRLDPGEMFESLQRAEYLKILGTTVRWSPAGIPNGVLHREAKAAFECIPIDMLVPNFVAVLKRRGQRGCSSDFLESVPSALKGLAISARLLPSQQQRVLAALAMPASVCFQI
ncbi:MAG TPA: sce7726 family protein [bacterium]|nr:sce7726 family protein [bacterium]